MLESLPELPRVTVADNAAFLGFEEGAVRLIVRSDFNRARVWETLKPVDFSEHFDGFKRLELTVDDDSGRTGRESHAIADAARREAARRAAESSPAVLRVLAAFGGRLERVEPSGVVPRELIPTDVETAEE